MRQKSGCCLLMPSHLYSITALLLSKHAYGSRVPWREQKMTRNQKRSRTKNSTRAKIAAKLSKKRQAATKSAPAANSSVTRSKAARANIAEGTRLFALAGRPTKAQFVKVYGAKGPTMTWAERAKAGVDAKHFQAALAAKSKA